MKYVRQWFFFKSSKRGKRKKGGKWNREEVFDILKKGKMWKSKRGLVGSYFQSGTGNGRAVIHEKCNFWERSRFSFSLSARVWHPGPGNVAPFWMVPVLVPKKIGPGKKYRYRKKLVPEKVPVPVPEKISPGKKYRYRYRKNLVPEKSTGTGTAKIRSRKKVPVPVPEKNGPGKKYRSRYRKKILVPSHSGTQGGV